jgi:hypothetical protein
MTPKEREQQITPRRERWSEPCQRLTPTESCQKERKVVNSPQHQRSEKTRHGNQASVREPLHQVGEHSIQGWRAPMTSAMSGGQLPGLLCERRPQRRASALSTRSSPIHSVLPSFLTMLTAASLYRSAPNNQHVAVE